MSHPKLEPCPFCGSEVEIKYHPGNYGYMAPSVRIRCEKCGCGFSEFTENWERGRGHYDCKEQATAQVVGRWNTRYHKWSE